MIRLVAVAFTALFCTGCQGCQSQRQPVDPFLGRTTVPPPGTGVIGPTGPVPDSGGFLQRAPATNPATGNQFTPPESNNDLYAPPGINNGIPTGSYGGGYQSSVQPPPQNTRWARANPNRTSASPASASPAAMASQPSSSAIPSGNMPIGVSQPSSSFPSATGDSQGNVQLTSGSQSWQPAQTDATAAATTSQPATSVNQIRIVPSNASPVGTGGGDPTDIMNLPPKSSSPASGGATM